MNLQIVSHYSKQVYRNVHGILGLRPTDIWLTSFPRSGNSWFRVILGNIINLIEQDGQTVDLQTLEALVPSLGLSNLQKPWTYRSLPRFIKTHQPYRSLFFQKPRRTVLIVRDPRDALISYFDLAQKSKVLNYNQTFSQFIRHPHYGMQSWIRHYQSWQPHATIVIYYESLRQDPQATLRTAFSTLHIPCEEAIIQEAIQRSSLEKLKKQEVESGIRDAGRYRSDFRAVRHGQSRSWLDSFSTEDLAYYQQICRTHNISIYQE